MTYRTLERPTSMMPELTPDNIRHCLQPLTQYNNQACHPLIDAAVMLLIQKRASQLVFVMIERSKKLRFHGGEVAFAGGRRENPDRNPADTAIRELHEELAIPAEKLNVLGLLPAVSTYSTGFLITPVVAFLHSDFNEFQPDPAEVDDVLFMPVVRFLMNPEVLGPEYYFLKGFRCEGKVVWGATARIIRKFLASFLGRPDNETEDLT